jgi:tetratricopeptide (TPR) repeat protein
VSAPLYFEGFRTAVARMADGLIRPGEPASPAQIAAAEKALGRRLPSAYAAFLKSFDGADLFNESLLLCGVGPDAACSLVEANRPPAPPLLEPGELVIAEAASGDRYALGAGDDPAVVHLRAGSDERWLSGSSFSRWLDVVLAREQLLYDSEGEFRQEAFEEDGEELTAPFALRQAERALRKDPGSAESHHDLGIARRRMGKLEGALQAFTRATELDPTNPWPWFDRARTELAREDAAAVDSFRQAATLVPGPEGARFLAWAARAGRDLGRAADAEESRQQALARDPDLPTSLRRAAEAAEAAEDPDARAEAEALAEAMEPPKKRLPILEG